MPKRVNDYEYYTIPGGAAIARYCGKDTIAIIPPEIDGYIVKVIGACSFQSKKVSKIIIPNTITKIESRAFEGCKCLDSVYIPNSIVEIGKYAFQGCTNLTSLTIPKNTKIIHQCAFEGCKNLKTVKIPDSVSYIGFGVFTDCPLLKEIQCKPNSYAERWAKEHGYNCIYNTSKLSTFINETCQDEIR